MKLKVGTILCTFIIICALVSSLIYAEQSNHIKSSNSNINKLIVKDSTTAKSYDYADLSMIKTQNEEYISKMLHNKKFFTNGKRKVVAYAGMHYDAQRRPMIKEMISWLKALGANCYSYLIDDSPEEDLGSLPEFCELALKDGIEVWVVLVPPSEEPGRQGVPDSLRYPPYGLNYVKWARRISKISKLHNNLRLFMIDDFAYNLKKFTPSYTKEVYAALKSINSNILFGVTYYEDQFGKKELDISEDKPYIEAVEWGYQANSKFDTDYGIRAKSLSINIKDFRNAFPNTLLVPCIYFNPNSSWKRKPTADYLNDAMSIAYREVGDFLIFCTPDYGTGNYKIVKDFYKENLRR